MNDAAAPAIDLGNCDREPIHIPGAIQPFGFLLAVSSDWLIARASANLEEFTGTAPAQALGRPLNELLDAEAVHTLRNRLTVMRGDGVVERVFAVRLVPGDERLFDVALHTVSGTVLIEAEPTAATDVIDTGSTVRLMMSRLDQASGLDLFFREGARQLRALTGFDRVMVYRFDAEGSGEVVAEAVRPGLGSFLNLRYPASDIPAQARELYVRNIFRIIADVGDAAVPIAPTLDERGRPLDLSLSVLRAVSPIHIEYLKNMGVAASLSISIVVEGRLWGLFACHHNAPRRPGFERRSICELFGQMFAMKLESRERALAAEAERHGRAIADRIAAAIASDASLMDDPAWLMDAIRQAIPSDGIGVAIDGRQALSGLAPGPDRFAAIVGALNATAAGRVFETDRIAALVPDRDEDPAAAGMLAIPISRRPRDFVVLFRQEAIRSVRWAGDPRKPVEFGPNGPRLTPRRSFEAWSELVRGRSAPFTPAETRIAETLRATLIEVVLRLSDTASAERQRFNDRQELLIAELNHRVRNILNLIRGLVRQTNQDGCSIDAYVDQLEGRIQALARAHNQITEDQWGAVPLRALIETEAGAYLAARSDRVTTEGVEILLQPQAFSTLALVVHELMTNSAKYGALSDSGVVSVSWRLDEDGSLFVDWRESGGPPVRAPLREGFGTTIITRSIPYDLGGDAGVDYRLGGIVAHFCVPARHVKIAAAAPAAGARAAIAEPQIREAEADRSLALAGRSVLLVEDSLIIALDTEDMLGRLGAAAVVSAATVRQALAEIDGATPDVAVLDINLGDATSFPIADRLRALGVPFLFASGYGEQAQLPEGHDVPVVRKPFTRESLGAALAGLLAG